MVKVESVACSPLPRSILFCDSSSRGAPGQMGVRGGSGTLTSIIFVDLAWLFICSILRAAPDPIEVETD
jgi:hypothetical protein